MADTTSDVPDYSVWGDEFKMEAFRADPAHWNKDWEKASRGRTAADVVIRMGAMFGLEKLPENLIPMFTEHMMKMQDILVSVWGTVEQNDRQFVTAWLLLGEKERTKHLNKGFEDAYPLVLGRQDARCFAPEITTSGLLKRNGQVFIELLEVCAKGKQGVGNGNPYIHPSEWWDKALDGVPESFHETWDERTYECMTLYRNDFISEFLKGYIRINIMLMPIPAKYLVHATISFIHDLGRGSAGMKPVTDLMTTHGSTAYSLGQAVSTPVRDEPIICCQNCETEELGPKFMVCSTCKSKLDFTIHYCSA